MIIFIILIIAFLIATIALIKFLHNCKKEVLLQQQEEQRLTQANIQAQSKLDEINRVIAKKEQNMSQQIEILNQSFVNKASEIEQKKIKLEESFNSKKAELENAISKEQSTLNSIVAKQQAYILEQQRKEQVEKQRDYYRLNLEESSKTDITFLREVQLRLAHKESIDKIIWEVYYKPAYDVLMSHLFTSSEKQCGIYKITCFTSQKAYIGQSTDIKERFRQHIKSALSNAPTTNKLYQEMKKFSPSDFSFEILETVPRAQLNEREVYWIDVYKTKDYGLNSTKGGS